MIVRVTYLDSDEYDYGMKVGDVYKVDLQYSNGDVTVFPPASPDHSVILSSYEYEEVL